eukprot:TRINITY_DN10159_c0_g2_i12.p1 TRINITY_DN10159_c0_g2~~TRINITY_DN10159_c0_g2_i12.p1  ORF type:complete len:339 (+),score=74.01 TRINITY_DN10159_c0_g2_i12:579-1595(+)
MRSLVDRRRGVGSQKSSSEPQSMNSQKQENAEENVIVLTDANFDSYLKGSNDLWMVKFFGTLCSNQLAPWCGHCKNMAQAWKEAARRLKGKVKFAEVDATVQKSLGQRFGINGYPTLKVFPPGGDIGSPLDYQGERSADAFESGALEYLRKYPAKKEILQLTGEEVMQSKCVDKKGICLISFLPHLADTKASGRRDYLKTLEDAANKNPQYPFYYFWAQAYDQKTLEKMFNLGSGYPTVVAISPSKQKYAVMRGAYTAETVSSFIRDLMHGYERLYEYKELPKLENIKPWDGSDYKDELCFTFTCSHIDYHLLLGVLGFWGFGAVSYTHLTLPTTPYV